MTARGQQVMTSLELVAQRHGDPMEAIYARLFAAHPEFQDLFVIDTDKSVRGAMLQHIYDCIDDYFAGNRVAFNFIASSRVLHKGYGVPADQFDLFFHAMKDTFQALLGPDWTSDMTVEWDEMLAAFATA